MKKIGAVLFGSTLLVSMKVFSIESSDYNTSTQILTIPSLAVKSQENGLDVARKYGDTTLFLNPDGTWKIMALDTSPSLFHLEQKKLAGYWIGESLTYPGEVCSHGAEFPRIGHYKISLMQNGDQLIGIVVGSPPCSISRVGNLVGKVTGEKVWFSIEFNGEEFIEFEGNTSHDLHKIEGSIVYKKPNTSYTGEKDSLSLSLH